MNSRNVTARYRGPSPAAATSSSAGATRQSPVGMMNVATDVRGRAAASGTARCSTLFSSPKNLTEVIKVKACLELVSEVDDEGAGHGADVDPVAAAVRDLEAGDVALAEQRDEVAVAVRRQAQRPRGVGARRVVVHGHNHGPAAELAVKVVMAEADALAQQPQQLHPQRPRRHQEPLHHLAAHHAQRLSRVHQEPNLNE
ncbi:hypothetical protein EJB05_15102, partial [Eragrostis curvula]